MIAPPAMQEGPRNRLRKTPHAIPPLMRNHPMQSMQKPGSRNQPHEGLRKVDFLES